MKDFHERLNNVGLQKLVEDKYVYHSEYYKWVTNKPDKMRAKERYDKDNKLRDNNTSSPVVVTSRDYIKY